MIKKLFLSFTSLLLIGISSISCGGSGAKESNSDSVELRIMTFNLRYANPADGAHYWDYRRDAVVRMIEDTKPDVMGIQEGLSSQMAFLDSALTGYSYVGVGRDDGNQAGEYAAIFYKDSLYSVVDDGHFWLSETPDVPKMGWDAVCVRIATWVRFQDKESGKEFLVFNTHFDHVGEVARRESAKLLLSKAQEFGDSIPTVIMGDFNFPVTNPSLAPLMNSPSFKEVRSSAARIPQGDSISAVTYRSFVRKTRETGAKKPTKPKKQGSPIDHIFCQGFMPEEYWIIDSGYGVPYLSDHLPVLAVLKY